jgi:hypothetical protein
MMMLMKMGWNLWVYCRDVEQFRDEDEYEEYELG